APLAWQKWTLLLPDHGREGEVVIGPERPEVRHRDCGPVPGARAEVRAQHAGLAFHGRIRCRKVRYISHRYARKFEACVLEIDHLLSLIVDDAGGFHLPFRWPRRILKARFAGGIDAVMEDREIAGALRARGGEAGLLGCIESQRIHETIAIIVAQVHDFAARDRAVTFRQLRISFAMQALGFLLI